jgi:hypothetical protein
MPTLDQPALDDVLYEHDMDGGEEGGVLILQHMGVVFILHPRPLYINCGIFIRLPMLSN